jgi:hypothetical protein
MTSVRSGPRALTALGVAAVLGLGMLVPAGASSHREAPGITDDPLADNTDVYAFVSPDKPDTVTLISNWIPFELPAGGPNFYNFGDDVLYTINIDNNGDAVADITYEWRFSTQLNNPNNPVPNTFLYNTGPITSLDDKDWNIKQTYTLSVVENGKRRTLGEDLPVPPNNIGPRSTPNYPELANAAITQVDGGILSFAGQRDESFPVDLGSIFDLGGLRPFNEAHLIKLPKADGINATDGLNVNSVALQVPIDKLVRKDDPVIAVWSSTFRRQTETHLGPTEAQGSGLDRTEKSDGPWVQVSRLGNPLVNEVVVPTELKDVFNALPPSADANVFPTLKATPLATTGPVPLVTDPILANLIEVLYPGVKVPPPPRNDLVAIFLTGIPDLNKPKGNVRPAELLRLNTSIKPTEKDPNKQNELGLLGGDKDGFPNGRRLGDDVVDIELRALAGATPFTPQFNKAPNNALGDGVSGNDQPFLTSFPYIPNPFNGYSYTPNPGTVTDPAEQALQQRP